MYLHLGQNTIVRFDDIIGIFDIDNTTVSKKTRLYLEKAQKSGRIFDISGELPRSFVVCKNKNDFMVYISQLSPSTLMRRSSYISIFN